MSTVEQRVLKIIAEQLNGDDLSDINENTSLVDDLGADSLDHVELAMALEEEFEDEFDIEDEAIEGWKTAGNVVKFIEVKVSECY